MRLQEYSEKPRAKFQGTDEYYLGVELEVEAPDFERRDKGLALKKKAWGMYAKKDSSLNSNGWELITHPIARNVWLSTNPLKNTAMRFYQMVKDLQSLGYNSHNGGRCGFHVHVSREAFGLDLRCEHFYWFSRLMNGKLFRKISQRGSAEIDTYARQSAVTIDDFASEACSRRIAVNITNKTVEVRIFRGNMRNDRLRKNIESVIAAIEFTKRRHSTFWPEVIPTSVYDSAGHTINTNLLAKNVEGDFMEFVAENHETYPNLFAFLREIGVMQSADLSDIAQNDEETKVLSVPVLA